MEEIIRKHVIFHGRVQGVGFRYRAYYAAKNMGLSGWVKNLYDGTVEMEVQGKQADVDAMLLTLEQNRYIHISQIDIENIPVKTEKKAFRILEAY